MIHIQCASALLYVPANFPLPTSAVLFLKIVLEAAKVCSAHAQGRLEVPGNEPSYLPPHMASHLQPMTGMSWYLNTLASPLDGDNSEVCVLYQMLSFPMGLNSSCLQW